MHVGRRFLQHLGRGSDDRGAVGQPPHDLAGQWQAARALVGGLGADDRAGDARDMMVLHVLADAGRPKPPAI